MSPVPVHLELLRNYNQLLPAPGERVENIFTRDLADGDKFRLKNLRAGGRH